MYIRSRKQFTNIIQHIFHELKSKIRQIHHNRWNSPSAHYLTLFFLLILKAAQLRIGRHGSLAMSWSFNFGYYYYKSVSCKLYNLLNLLLCIKSTMWFIIIFFVFIATINATCKTNFGAASKCSNLSQKRIFRNFYAPALIIGQMKMKFIKFEIGECVQKFQNEFKRLEMTRYIEMHAAPFKTGIIGYFYTIYAILLRTSLDYLFKSLNCVKESVWSIWL